MSFNKKRLAKIASNPMVRLGIPAMATVLLGTLFYSEIVRINHLVPNRPSGLKEEDIVDSFNIDHELKKINQSPDLDTWVSKRVSRPGDDGK